MFIYWFPLLNSLLTFLIHLCVVSLASESWLRCVDLYKKAFKSDYDIENTEKVITLALHFYLFLFFY